MATPESEEPLVAILDAVEAKVRSREAFAAVLFRTGAAALPLNDAPRRVVWVPLSEAGGPAPTTGGRRRQLRSVTARVEAHCWGGDVAEAAALRSALIDAFDRTVRGNFKFVGGRWPTEQRAAHSDRGDVLVALFDVRFVVMEPERQRVTIDSVGFDNDGAVAGDGILETGDT